MADSPVLTLSSVIMTLRRSSDPKCILCGKCARLVIWEGRFLVTSYVTSTVGQKGRGRRGRGRNAMTTRVVRRFWETFRSSNTEISLYVCSLVMMGIATRRSQKNWREFCHPPKEEEEEEEEETIVVIVPKASILEARDEEERTGNILRRK